MRRKNEKGFTLIELLVVFAIIAVLIAIVIASIVSARNKATDKAIQQNLITIRTQAAIYSDTVGAGSYGTATPMPPTSSNCSTGMFTADSTIANAITKLQSYTVPDNVACTSIGTSFAVAVKLTNQNYFCIDSTATQRVNSGQGGLYDIFGTDSTAAINAITATCH